jgi:hypothetical protein
VDLATPSVDNSTHTAERPASTTPVASDFSAPSRASFSAANIVGDRALALPSSIVMVATASATDRFTGLVTL